MSNKTSTALRVGGVPEHFSTPWHVAVDENAFADCPVNVEFITYPTGTGAMCADLSAGKIDMAMTLTEGAVRHQYRHDDVLIVAPYVETPLTWGVYVAKETTIKTLADCKDKRFAISRHGSGSHLMACVMSDAVSQAIIPEENFIEVGGIENLCHAIEQVEADCFMWEVFTTAPWLEKKEIQLLDTFPTPWPCFCMTVNSAYWQRHSDVIKQIIRVVHDISDSFNNNKCYAIEKIQKYYPMQEDSLNDWLAKTTWSTSMNITQCQVESILKSLARLKML